MANVKWSSFSTVAPAGGTVVGLQGGVNVAYAFPTLSGQTGTGNYVGATSPTLITPALGTPASGSLANCTGYTIANVAGLGAGIATFLATPSSANLLAAVTDETGSGLLVFGTSPTIVTPVILQINSTAGAGIGISGTTTAGSATAGNVGEVVTSTVTGVAIVNQTSTNVTSISLTAGDWDVTGNILTVPAAATTQGYAACAISTVSATLPAVTQGVCGTAAAQIPLGPVAPTTRINVSATTTVYLVGNVSYAGSTLTTNGYIFARRRR